MPTTTERVATPPREMRRTSPFVLVRDTDTDAVNDGLTLDGYAAVFNRESVIDSWEGRFREKIALGAMKRSFSESPPRVQFDHGHHPLIGSIPIAALQSAREEVDPVRAPEGGAHIIARLHDNWLIQPVRDAIASEPPSIDGMSFRFAVLQEMWQTADGKTVRDESKLRQLLRETLDAPDEELLLRTLRQLKVPEVGPVVWPAYTDTSVAVRSRTITIDLARIHEPEVRTELARAVLMADQVDAEEPQPITADDAAERHEDPADDAQSATAQAGEHESAPPRGQRPIDMWVRKARDTVLNIDRKAGAS